MIANDQELHVMFERIRHFQEQVAHYESPRQSQPTFACRLRGFWLKSIGCSSRFASTSASTRRTRQWPAEDPVPLTGETADLF